MTNLSDKKKDKQVSLESSLELIKRQEQKNLLGLYQIFLT